jgi:hypothetical protein
MRRNIQEQVDGVSSVEAPSSPGPEQVPEEDMQPPYKQRPWQVELRQQQLPLP